MTFKVAVAGLPLGSGKGGIVLLAGRRRDQVAPAVSDLMPASRDPGRCVASQS
jgi:hypothetical protein